MRTKFIAFRTASETAAEAERAEQFLKAAQFWRKAYQLAPSTQDEDWCFARANQGKKKQTVRFQGILGERQ